MGPDRAHENQTWARRREHGVPNEGAQMKSPEQFARMSARDRSSPVRRRRGRSSWGGQAGPPVQKARGPGWRAPCHAEAVLQGQPPGLAAMLRNARGRHGSWRAQRRRRRRHRGCPGWRRHAPQREHRVHGAPGAWPARCVRARRTALPRPTGTAAASTPARTSSTNDACEKCSSAGQPCGHQGHAKRSRAWLKACCAPLGVVCSSRSWASKTKRGPKACINSWRE